MTVRRSLVETRRNSLADLKRVHDSDHVRSNSRSDATADGWALRTASFTGFGDELRAMA